jgi:hypothetical protein
MRAPEEQNDDERRECQDRIGEELRQLAPSKQASGVA